MSEKEVDKKEEEKYKNCESIQELHRHKVWYEKNGFITKQIRQGFLYEVPNYKLLEELGKRMIVGEIKAKNNVLHTNVVELDLNTGLLTNKKGNDV